MKKFIITFILSILFIMPAYADELAKNAKSAILIEASTGKVLYEKNADEALAPASMTKMMTLLLTMEAIERGQIALEDNVNVSERAAKMGGSQVYLEANSTYTLDEIIKAVCIASGNDAAVVLAENIGGSVESFVEMMNKRAKELGLTATNFVNVYGLDADGHLSSARDMALIAKELVKHELILQYSSIYEDYLQKKDGSSLWMVNTNKLIRYYQGIDGLKTGYTSKAGYCLTATGMWNNMRLISVVMGESTQEDRTKDTTALINYGKATYKINTILESDKNLGNIEVELGQKTTVPIKIENSVTDLVKMTEEAKNYTYEIKLDKVIAPLKKGGKVGTLYVYANENEFTKEDIIITESVPKCSFFTSMKRTFKELITLSK